MALLNEFKNENYPFISVNRTRANSLYNDGSGG